MLHLKDNVALCPNHLCHTPKSVSTHLQLSFFYFFFSQSCSPGCPYTVDPSASTSQVLELQSGAIMFSYSSFLDHKSPRATVYCMK